MKDKASPKTAHILKAEALAKQANKSKFRDFVSRMTIGGVISAGWTVLNKRCLDAMFDVADRVKSSPTMRATQFTQFAIGFTQQFTDLRDVGFVQSIKTFAKEMFGKAREDMSKGWATVQAASGASDMVRYTIQSKEKWGHERGSFQKRFNGFVKKFPQEAQLVVMSIAAALAATLIGGMLYAGKRRKRNIEVGKEFSKAVANGYEYAPTSSTIAASAEKEPAVAAENPGGDWQNKLTAEPQNDLAFSSQGR